MLYWKCQAKIFEWASSLIFRCALENIQLPLLSRKTNIALKIYDSFYNRLWLSFKNTASLSKTSCSILILCLINHVVLFIMQINVYNKPFISLRKKILYWKERKDITYPKKNTTNYSSSPIITHSINHSQRRMLRIIQGKNTETYDDI